MSKSILFLAGFKNRFSTFLLKRVYENILKIIDRCFHIVLLSTILLILKLASVENRFL
jgi:hypothetical protein